MGRRNSTPVGTLIATIGPPGAGKSTWRRRRLTPEMTLVSLDRNRALLYRPYRLVFQAGPDLSYSLPGDGRGGRRYARRAEPTDSEQRYLDRVAGRILGTGCVVSEQFDPHRHDADTAWQAQQRARAGVRLAPVDDPCDPADWLINEPLTR